MALTEYQITELIASTGLNRCLVVAFSTLSLPIRALLRNQLETQKVYLQAQLSRFTSIASKGNVLSNRVTQQKAAIDAMLAPTERTLNMISWQTLAKDCPGIMEFLTSLLGQVSQRVAVDTPVGELNFEGVKSYPDLKRKSEKLQYEASKIASTADYASKYKLKITNQLAKIDSYISLIDSL